MGLFPTPPIENATVWVKTREHQSLEKAKKITGTLTIKDGNYFVKSPDGIIVVPKENVASWHIPVQGTPILTEPISNAVIWVKKNEEQTFEELEKIAGTLTIKTDTFNVETDRGVIVIPRKNVVCWSIPAS
jgi:hypothetical protein